MLKDNLKTLRKNKGLSQEELSIKLNVVRQTVSKWESGLSVPDAEMLITTWWFGRIWTIFIVVVFKFLYF